MGSQTTWSYSSNTNDSKILRKLEGKNNNNNKQKPQNYWLSKSSAKKTFTCAPVRSSVCSRASALRPARGARLLTQRRLRLAPRHGAPRGGTSELLGGKRRGDEGRVEELGSPACGISAIQTAAIEHFEQPRLAKLFFFLSFFEDYLLAVVQPLFLIQCTVGYFVQNYSALWRMRKKCILNKLRDRNLCRQRNGMLPIWMLFGRVPSPTWCCIVFTPGFKVNVFLYHVQISPRSCITSG